MKKLIYFFTIFLLILGGCDDNHIPPPKPIFDDLEFSTPGEQGLNATQISQAINNVQQQGFINSIVIVRNGNIVSEWYLNGFGQNNGQKIMSVSKSILSALVGIALREGFLDSLGQKMLDFFPEYITTDLESKKYDITIKHLLTMKAGLEHEHENYWQIYNSDNWIKTTIEFPFAYDPGEKFSYNTFQTHLLSGVLTKATGMSTLEFANKYFAERFRIEFKDWERDPQGIYFGGNGIYLTTRDMARFGWLYLRNGLLDGKQIVPIDWIEESLTNTTGFSSNSWGDLRDYNYGYLWWLGKLNDYEVYLALGYGGQFIINIPELNMIVVTTSNSFVDWDTADEQERAVLSIVANNILTAVVD